MALFNKKPKSDPVTIAVKKVREKYRACIDEYQTGETLSQEFEDRYLTALKNRRINLLHFLYQEYVTAEAIYKAGARKRQEEELEQMKLADLRERDPAGTIYAEFESRLRKYQPSGFAEEDNELNRLFGAFSKVYNSLWVEAEPLLRRKYKAAVQNPVHQISSDLYEFIPRPGEKLPHSLLHYKTALRRDESEQSIEKHKNIILRKAAFLLHKIEDTLCEATDDDFLFTQDELFRIENIQESVSGMIYDFRLISFHGQPTVR